MGSRSDNSTMIDCEKILKTLKIKYQVLIVSAHRTPKRMFEFADNASKNGFAVAICSSAPKKAIEKCIKLLRIETCINTVVSTETLIRGKPDKFPYVETLRLLNVSSKNAIVFEDAAAGLTSSIAAGIKTVCVGSHIELHMFPCKMFANSISDIYLVEGM